MDPEEMGTFSQSIYHILLLQCKSHKREDLSEHLPCTTHSFNHSLTQYT